MSLVFGSFPAIFLAVAGNKEDASGMPQNILIDNQ
jgi:hypothetical protein